MTVWGNTGLQAGPPELGRLRILLGEPLAYAEQGLKGGMPKCTGGTSNCPNTLSATKTAKVTMFDSLAMQSNMGRHPMLSNIARERFPRVPGGPRGANHNSVVRDRGGGLRQTMNTWDATHP